MIRMVAFVSPAFVTRVALLTLLLRVSSTTAAEPEPQATVDIYVPTSIPGLWGRFFILEKASRIAGWVTSQDAGNAQRITGIHASDETRFKAIVYVPGCALQTVDLAISERKTYQYSFVCTVVPEITLQGNVGHPVLYSQGVTVEAKYAVLWAPAFFQCDDGTTTEIPIGGKANLDGQRFSLSIPDLSKDKLANVASHQGEVRIFVRDQASGRIVDKLTLVSSTEIQAGRMGGIPIPALSTPRLSFDFCETGSTLSHDQYGFTLRDDAAESCVR